MSGTMTFPKTSSKRGEWVMDITFSVNFELDHCAWLLLHVTHYFVNASWEIKRVTYSVAPPTIVCMLD